MVTAGLSSEAVSQVSPVPVRLPFEGAERPWSTRLPGPRRPGPGGGREAEMPASSWSAPVPGTGDRVSILGCRMGDRVAARGPGGWPLHPLLSPAPDRELEEFIPGAGAGAVTEQMPSKQRQVATLLPGCGDRFRVLYCLVRVLGMDISSHFNQKRCHSRR